VHHEFQSDTSSPRVLTELIHALSCRVALC
jgi:hypothetical protein